MVSTKHLQYGRISPLRGYTSWILLGIVTESKKIILHHLILLARHHIYICRLKETRPSLEVYKQLAHNTLQIEKKKCNS